MSNPVRDLDAALSSVADRWDGARTERTLEGLHQKQKRRRTRAVVGAAAGAVAVVLVAAFAITFKPAPKPTLAVSQPVASQPLAAANALHLELADGSEVWLHDRQARVRVDEVTPASVSLELEAGRARFDVIHREARKFRVQSGEVAVEVLGTAFELEREPGRTRVLVLRGRVAVSWPDGRTELAAGEAGWFPRTEPEITAAHDTETQARAGGRAARNAQRAQLGAATARGAKAGRREDSRLKLAAKAEVGDATDPREGSGSQPAAATARVEKASGHAAATWRDPAEQGDFDHAYELLTRSARPVADDVEELLLAADTARLSGHPEEALPFLQRVVDRHTADSRAPLAAFTLGGVLMQQLGQPREAEVAYARARAMSLNASLAEDALARQVEAAHRAGDSAHARELAREYLDQYPRGRRVHAVQRFGGLAH